MVVLPSTTSLVNLDGVVSLNLNELRHERLIEKKGKLPALGWNSWNAFKCDIDSIKIMTAANQVVTLGLKDAGYKYINSESHLEEKPIKIQTEPSR